MGILTETTFPVTAITIRNTRTIVNSLGTFVCRHIQPDLDQGFQIMEAYGVPYAKASVAKALFDHLCLRPLATDLEPQRYDLTEDLRPNLEELAREEREELGGYVLKTERNRRSSAKMRRVLNRRPTRSGRRTQ